MDFLKKLTNRRNAIFLGVSALSVSVWAAFTEKFNWLKSANTVEKSMNAIKHQFRLDFQWPTQEPFLFCVHHLDHYPVGNPNFGPAKSYLSGRNLGMDFDERDGFRMYHGEEVPGFPVHPHRGFETVTIVRRGLVDHADSMGAAGRYGEGDVQWMTAGSGVQHSEMFPLLKQDTENTVELFQIWLNLPKKNKMVQPHFKMFWSEEIPQVKSQDGKVSITIIAGTFAGREALKPPPDSWAADSTNEVMILLCKASQGGEIEIPAAQQNVNRTLYFFSGRSLDINGNQIQSGQGLILDAFQKVKIVAQNENAEFLLLQAKAIGEPTVQHGPFVMNSKEEIVATIEDYRRTEFGGWSWPRQDMVHGPGLERFARFPDGRLEKPIS